MFSRKMLHNVDPPCGAWGGGGGGGQQRGTFFWGGGGGGGWYPNIQSDVTTLFFVSR